MTSHYHYGHAVTGRSPEREHLSTCLTLRCLADCVRTELDHIGDGLLEQAASHESDGRDLETRVTGVGEYASTWEAVADRYRSALDCHAMVRDNATLYASLSPERERAPFFADRPDMREAILRRDLLELGYFPMYTDSAESRQFQVWECSESWCDWTHADYPHEPGYLPDCLACQTRCHCCGHAGHEDCVHCALVESGESTCDESNGCEAHD